MSTLSYPEIAGVPATGCPGSVSGQVSEMEQFTVERDGARPLKFTGELLAEAATSPNTSGTTGRWQELSLYRTKAGKYVCQQIGFTQWQGEHDRYSAAVCDDVDSVMEFFGHGRLAKDLYDLAGLDTAIEVE